MRGRLLGGAIVLAAVLAASWSSCGGPAADAPSPAGAPAAPGEGTHGTPEADVVRPARVRAAAPEPGPASNATAVITGTVRAAESDEPIESAVVRVFLREKPRTGNFRESLDPPPRGEPIAQTRTGADGRFEFGASAESVVLLVASAARRASASIYARPGDDVAISLSNGQDSTFTVIDEERRPIAGATLTAYGDHLRGGPRAGTVTDGEGRARLVVAAKDSLLVEAEGFETTAVDEAAAAASRPIVLRRGTVIAGVVVDRAGNSVAGARLEFERPPLPPVAGFSDPKGAFAFRGIGFGWGETGLSVTADGFAPCLVVVVPGDAAVRIVLSRGARVTGTVRFANGTPVAGANISVERQDRRHAASGTSDRNGRFLLDRVESGDLTITAYTSRNQSSDRPVRLEPSASVRAPLQVPEGGDDVDVRLVLVDRPTSYFRLRFVDARGTAVDPEQFLVSGYVRREMWTPKGGDFVAAAFAAAGTSLDLAVNRKTAGALPPQTVRVKTADDPDCPATVVPLADDVGPDERLTVIVRDPSGGELPPTVSATLSLGETWAFQRVAPLETAADRATWRVAKDKRYVLDVGARGYGTQRFAVDAPGTREVRLVPAARLRVRLTAADGSAAEDRDARAVVASADERTSQWFRPEYGGTPGAFVFDDLPPGRCELTVNGPEGVVETTRTVELVAGADVDLGELKLPTRAELSGTVRDAEGRPLGGAEVAFTANGTARTSTGPDGRYSLPLPRGVAGPLVVTKEGFGSGVAWTEADGRTPRDFRLGPEAQVLVVVRRPPASAWSLRVRTTDGRVQWQPEQLRTERGRVLRGVPPGPVVVVLDAAVPRTREVVAIAGQTIEVEFEE